MDGVWKTHAAAFYQEEAQKWQIDDLEAALSQLGASGLVELAFEKGGRRSVQRVSTWLMYHAQQKGISAMEVLDAITPTGPIERTYQREGPASEKTVTGERIESGHPDHPDEMIHGVVWRAVIDDYDGMGWRHSNTSEWQAAISRACSFRCLTHISEDEEWVPEACGHGAPSVGLEHAAGRFGV
jgi:hypothetical protein